MMVSTTRRPMVAHWRSTWLGLSETFIYYQIRELRSVRNIILTRRRENLDKFGVEDIYCPADLRRGTAPWMANRIGQLMGREPFFEQRMRKAGAALLHARFGYDGVRALRLKRRVGVPLITSFYGSDATARDILSQFRKGYEELFQQGECFLAEGSHMADTLESLGCPAQKIRIIHVGIPIADHPFTPRPPVETRPILLFCARFTEKKGLPVLLDALRILKERGLETELRIIGYGPQGDREHEDIIERHGLRGNVRLLGPRPVGYFIDQLRQAHVFVQPSVTASDGDQEGGAPTTLIQAQAVGCPVVSTHHCDIPEVVLDGETGLLAPEHDSEKLARHIETIITDPALQQRMGSAGRNHVEAEYDVCAETRKLERIYHEVIETGAVST